MRPGERVGRGGERGYTLVAVLLLLALLMLTLSIAGPMWSQQVRRDRERELLRIGGLYAEAIARYHDASPGGLKQYPQRLEALLMDSRYVGVARHLRRLYADPVNPGQPWGLVRAADGGIVGVYSLSEDTPMAEGPVARADLVLPPARRFADWKFIAKVGI